MASAVPAEGMHVSRCDAHENHAKRVILKVYDDMAKAMRVSVPNAARLTRRRTHRWRISVAESR